VAGHSCNKNSSKPNTKPSAVYRG